MATLASPPSAKATLAEETWRALWDYFISSRPQRDALLAEHGLTPNDSKALFSLDGEEGKPMGALAGQWTCDASNATWIIDRLESRGLAERRPSPGDRRVKMVVLTPLGVKTRDRMLAALYRPPPELLDLDRKDLEGLRDALRKMTAGFRDRAEGGRSSARRRA